MGREIRFTKMTAGGNDFIVIDNRGGMLRPPFEPFVRAACRRRLSVGADGVLLAEKDPEYDFRMRYLNADGGEVEMCGNGARCIARFASLRGIAGRKMRFRSGAGIHEAEVTDAGVRLRMTDPTDLRPRIEIPCSRGTVEASFINTGVPHVVIPVDDLAQAPVVDLGREIRSHRLFEPEGTNVNFMMRVGGGLSNRTYERGVEDETLACGTGAVAAALIGHQLFELRPPIAVATRGGRTLAVDFMVEKGEYRDVFLEGEAKLVFEGTLVDQGE
jgi:diaminopimelate epimerase